MLFRFLDDVPRSYLQSSENVVRICIFYKYISLTKSFEASKFCET